MFKKISIFNKLLSPAFQQKGICFVTNCKKGIIATFLLYRHISYYRYNVMSLYRYVDMSMFRLFKKGAISLFNEYFYPVDDV